MSSSQTAVTRYDYLMSQMNVETMAKILVKPAVVNHSELYYVTSSGQLFPFEEYERAYNYEINSLLSKINVNNSENASQEQATPVENTENASNIGDTENK